MDEQLPSVIQASNGRLFEVVNVAEESDVAVQHVGPISDLRVLPEWQTREGFPVRKNDDGSFVVKTTDGELICEEPE